MDQMNMQDQNIASSGTPDSAAVQPQGDQGGASSCAQDVMACLPFSENIRTLLRKMRAPAVHITFRMHAHIIPDLDTAKAAQPAAEGQETSAGENGTQEKKAPSANQKQEEVSITVRLFDIGLVMVAGCILKCSCGCARGVKHMCRKMM